MSDHVEVVRETLKEAAAAEPTRDRVLARLRDWSDRVTALYALIERGLGPRFTVRREGEHRSAEEMVQRAGIAPPEVPPVPMLEVLVEERRRAFIQPRGLWVIGANGRLDLHILPPDGGRKLYVIVDRSVPLSGPADWRLAPLSRKDEEPFTPQRLAELIG